MRTSLRLVTMLIIICVFENCKKQSEALPTYPIPAAAMAYINLTLGEHFAYRDSADNQVYSMVVTESIVAPFLESGWSAGYYDDYTLELSQPSFGGTAVWLRAAGEATTSPTAFGIVDVTPGAVYLGLPVFSYPACDCDGYGNTQQNIASMTVEGKTYTDVILTGWTLNGSSAYYYWAKGVGLIKRVENNGTNATTYSLVTYGP